MISGLLYVKTNELVIEENFWEGLFGTTQN